MKKRKENTRKPFAIFLRGGTGVGKTTIGKKLSEKISPSVFIEQDILRYMVVNGLVASRTGLHPGDLPDEYRRQCKLGDKNTMDLVRNFIEAGFNVIVDGFNGGESGDTFTFLEKPEEISWYPDESFFEKELKNIQIYQIVIDTKEDILIKRLKEDKEWNDEVISFILKQRRMFLQALKSAKVDIIIDSSFDKPDEIVLKILSKINL